ncbi:MAG: response regulator [Pseudomonadota bacterium]|nr:response regulator [Pseudomonadota bacterium]
METQRVLLVEDNEDDLVLASMAFERTGWPHILIPMRDGEEVLQYLYDGVSDGAPAVVFLDLKLPRVDGKTILRELRGNPRTTRVPVVVLSSSRLEQDVVDAYCLGANSYLCKQMDFAHFAAATTIATSYWLGLNVPPPGVSGPWSRLELLKMPSVLQAQQLIPRRSDPTQEIVVMDGDRHERDLTLEGIASSNVRNPTRQIGTFEEIVQFLRPAGGPPPLLRPDFPRLFLLDDNLPDGDGRDVLQALRYRADHHALLVMFTHNRSPAFLSECYRQKVSSIVFKPDDPNDYRDAVRLIAHYWIHMNEPPPDPSWSVRAMAHPG